MDIEDTPVIKRHGDHEYAHVHRKSLLESLLEVERKQNINLKRINMDSISIALNHECGHTVIYTGDEAIEMQKTIDMFSIDHEELEPCPKCQSTPPNSAIKNTVLMKHNCGCEVRYALEEFYRLPKLYMKIPCKDCENKDQKFGDLKPRYSLLPYAQLEEVVKVLTYGAKKYSDSGWKELETGLDQFFSTTMEYLIAWKKGEKLNPKSELPYLAHAACNILFLMWHDEKEKKPLVDIKLKLDTTNIKTALYKISLIKGRNLWKQLGKPWHRLKEGAPIMVINADGTQTAEAFISMKEPYRPIILASETYANLKKWLLPEAPEPSEPSPPTFEQRVANGKELWNSLEKPWNDLAHDALVWDKPPGSKAVLREFDKFEDGRVYFIDCDMQLWTNPINAILHDKTFANLGNLLA